MSSTEVFKFGGTSVGSPEAIRTAVAHVRHAAPNVLVVVSAMAGVTDLLLRGAVNALRGETDEAAKCAAAFRTKHADAVGLLIASGRTASSLESMIEGATRELLAMYESIAILRELTTRTRDAVAGRGERALARIFAAALDEAHVRCVYVDAVDILHTQRKMGALWPELSATRNAAASRLLPILAGGAVAVVPGFIGAGPDGELVTLGRGGSDFSAAILARAIDAKSLTLWKEVDGLMTADPRAVAAARVIPELHYREAGELAYYGAKVLHPRTMIPLVEAGIPLHVRNTFNPGFSGTRIAADVEPGRYPVKALTAVPGQALIAVEGGGMVGVPGIAARTFSALAHAGHSVSMISQASSESSICFVVPESEADDAARALREEFELELRDRLIDSIRVDRGVALVAVVGLGMRGTPGIAARTFAAVSRARVNVIAIAQGSSELNITLGIRDADVAAALNALHSEFQLDKIRPLPERNVRDASLTLLGFGQIGRALTRQLIAQESYFRHGLGATIRCVALADRSGVVVREDGFAQEELLQLVEQKEKRVNLASLEHLAAPGANIDAVTRALRDNVWQLPASRAILVDMTAEQTAPLLREAMKHQCHIVVANKKPLAVPQEEFDDLMETARSSGVAFRYEATVGAGLPILDTLAKLREAGDQVEMILGCLSGTLGYLMTHLEEGSPFSASVRQAWALGYTEPDPRDDLSGMDVARKALILARTLGRKLDIAAIAVEPLFTDAESDPEPERFVQKLRALDGPFQERLARARRDGCVLRYVARIEPGTIRVGIEAVPENSPMGRLRGTDNQIVLVTKRYRTNPLVVTGPGAGAEVTAAGVLNDIVAVTMGA